MEEAALEPVKGIELDTPEGVVAEQLDGADVDTMGKKKVKPTGATEKKGKVHRAKQKCPFTSCSKEVVHLPRHEAGA